MHLPPPAWPGEAKHVIALRTFFLWLDLRNRAAETIADYPGSAPRRNQRKAKIAALAQPAMAAIIKKNSGFSMRLQKLPSQPARNPPMKLVASQTPIIIDKMRTGATLVTSESPTGDK